MAIHLISPAPNAPILNAGKKIRMINKKTEMLSIKWCVVIIPITRPVIINRFGILLLHISVITATASNNNKKITIFVTSYRNTNKEFFKKLWYYLYMSLKCLIVMMICNCEYNEKVFEIQAIFPNRQIFYIFYKK